MLKFISALALSVAMFAGTSTLIAGDTPTTAPASCCKKADCCSSAKCCDKDCCKDKCSCPDCAKCCGCCDTCCK